MPPAVTPVTRPPATSTCEAGALSTTAPAFFPIASTSAWISVSEPPSMWPSSSCIIERREVPMRLMRVQIHAAEMLSAYS